MRPWVEGYRPRDPREIMAEATARGLRTLANLRSGALTQYQTNPIGFLTEELHIPLETIYWGMNPGYENHRWDGTEEPLVTALEALAQWDNVAVEAGTATSKTYVLGAGALLWFLCCWENAWVVTVAPKQEQLQRNLWKEVQKLWPEIEQKFPKARIMQLQIRMRGGTDEEWTAFGFVAGVGQEEESANRARGMHAEHMLVIYEETPGIHPAILTAFENTCTAPHNLRLALGNPDHMADELHKMVESPDFIPIRISALDYPNVVMNVARDPGWHDLKNDHQLVPGAVSRITVKRRQRKYLEDAPWLYDAMVRGISPRESSNALIKWAWCEEAAERYPDLHYRSGARALGVDVAASETGDKGAFAHYSGHCLTHIEAFPCPDPVKLGTEVAVLIAVQGLDPMHVGVDSIGVGSGTVNKLKELEVIVRSLNSGSSPEPEIEEEGFTRAVGQEALFANLRSQMWWQMREDLQYGRLALPRDLELFRELTVVEFKLTNGKIRVQPKDEIREKLGRSPDKADAAVYGNWVRPRELIPAPNDDSPVSAWDPEILAKDAEACRRINPMVGTHRPAEIEALLS